MEVCGSWTVTEVTLLLQSLNFGAILRKHSDITSRANLDPQSLRKQILARAYERIVGILGRLIVFEVEYRHRTARHSNCIGVTGSRVHLLAQSYSESP